MFNMVTKPMQLREHSYFNRHLQCELQTNWIENH